MSDEIEKYVAAKTPGAGPDRRILDTLLNALIGAQNDRVRHVARCTGESEACHAVTAACYDAQARYDAAIAQMIG